MYMESALQVRLVTSLELGLMSKCVRVCVMALTTCALEMKRTMYKLMPEVLLRLSRISSTNLIAVPILEFLASKY